MVTGYDENTDGAKQAFFSQLYLSFKNPKHPFSQTLLWHYTNDEQFTQQGTLLNLTKRDGALFQRSS